MFSSNEVVKPLSVSTQPATTELANHNREALLATGFHEIGINSLFRKEDSFIAITSTGKIEFYTSIDRVSPTNGEKNAIEICQISYRENVPVFKIQREGIKCVGEYGLTGSSHSSPKRLPSPNTNNTSLREYLLSNDFIADADDTDILRYAIPVEATRDRMLAPSVIAIFEGSKLTNLLMPEGHYGFAQIRELDTLSVGLESELRGSAREEPQSGTTPSTAEAWIASMQENSPPWDMPTENSFDEVRALFREINDNTTPHTSPEVTSHLTSDAVSHEILFLGNHRYRVPLIVHKDLNIQIEAKFFSSFPTDLELDIIPATPIVTPSGFVVGGENSVERIRALSDFNNRSLSVIEETMRPGENSLGGFLGDDERLIDVLERDNVYITSLGLNHQDIGFALRRIVALATRTAHDSITVGKAEIEVVAVIGGMGTQESPFGDDSKGQYDIRLRNTRNGETLWIPEILPHLIELYGFYEGTGSPYRVAPEKIVSFLELAS